MEQYIQPFIKVCETVFHDFCQTEVKSGKVYFVEKDNFGSEWDISGVIGFTGEAKGAVVISMKNATAFHITKTLTGTEHESVDEDVMDAVGEIINIIAGNVKSSFEESLRMTISLPSIVKGKGHSIIWPVKKTRILCISFLIFDNQEFSLSMAVDESK